jgi:hypothetical protein
VELLLSLFHARRLGEAIVLHVDLLRVVHSERRERKVFDPVQGPKRMSSRVMEVRFETGAETRTLEEEGEGNGAVYDEAGKNHN